MKCCDGPIERELLEAEVLADAVLVTGGALTLEVAKFVRAGSDLKVIYTRREVETATEAATSGDKRVGSSSRPFTEIEWLAFELCQSALTMTIPESVTLNHQDATWRVSVCPSH